MTHVRTLLTHSSKIFTALVAAALIFTWSTSAEADHEPANKFAAAGAATEEIDPESTEVILSETMKVSSPFDLALSATAECSILTYLRSAPTSSGVASDATGSVDLHITIDGKRVPVQTTGYEGPGAQDGADDGSVTFCNRTYERTILNSEGDDGIDEERDFIRTKNANAFNWFALNVGESYDEVGEFEDGEGNPVTNGNNVVLIELHATYTSENGEACAPSTATNQEDCSDAYVGKRTLVAEPTNASVHEQVEPADPDGGS